VKVVQATCPHCNFKIIPINKILISCDHKPTTLKRLVILILWVPFIGFSQSINDTALITRATTLYREKKLDAALLTLDSAIVNPTAKNDPRTWTVRAYVYYEYYKVKEKKKLYSSLCDSTVNSVIKSMSLKPDTTYQGNNRRLLRTLGATYYNFAKHLLEDSLDYSRSKYAYNKYKELFKLIDPQTDFKKKDIEYYQAKISVLIEDKIKKWSKSHNADTNELVYVINEIKILNELGEKLYAKMSEALIYANYYIVKSYMFQNQSISKQALLDLSNANIKLSELKVERQKKGIELLNKEKALNDALFEKQIIETKKKETEVKQQRMIKNISLMGVLLLFLLVFFVYRSLRLNKKQNKIILHQKEMVEYQKEITEGQKKLIEEKQHEIMDSLNYAKRIQFALLASEKLLNDNLPEYFVFFQPKDVVSGDFYWATNTPAGFLYITADCTGHGVPGAFMSLLNISKLSQTINENKVIRPDLVFNAVRSEIISVLNPEGSMADSKDGMDAVLCMLDLVNMKLSYSAANNSFYIIRGKAIIHCKADKMPVGRGHDDSVSFSYNEIIIQKGDLIYTFTDGLADQFGGARGKKFKYKQLEEILLNSCHLSMQEQKEILLTRFERWKGVLEQVDDVCVIGVRV
jgi:serine phosphatase RsbU (regulator of sigma subunit)